MSFTDRGDGIRLATALTPGHGPTTVFLPGYMSDMAGTKALHLEARAVAQGRAMLRLDYSGCGASEGRFEDGTISRWAEDARAAINALAPGPVVLVGSSMGGWIALRLAAALGGRGRGLVLVAPAPDFTRWGVRPTTAERAELEVTGRLSRPSDYGGNYIYTAKLLDDGERCAILDAAIPIACPVRILHGQADPDVPWGLSLTVAERLASSDVQLTLVKDGDHRLSRPSDLELLAALHESLPCFA